MRRIILVAVLVFGLMFTLTAQDKLILGTAGNTPEYIKEMTGFENYKVLNYNPGIAFTTRGGETFTVVKEMPSGGEKKLIFVGSMYKGKWILFNAFQEE